MINLQVSCSDIMGARFNGRDLHKDLNKRGIKSKHLVWSKNTNEPDTVQISRDLENRVDLNKSLGELERLYSAQSLFHPFSYDLMFNKEFLGSDIVHYHLIHNNFFNFSHLPILTKLKPTVWTIHDPWAVTGHCIHPMGCEKWKTGCGNCPDLKNYFEIKNDTTALNWEIKKEAILNSKLDIIVASEWMYDLVSASPMFKNAKLHIVPFGLDLSKFKPMDSAVEKKKLGIPTDNIVISFRSTDSKYKGLDYIKAALNNLKTDKKITLLTFNDKGLVEELKDKYQVIDLGWVDKEIELVSAYNASDIFLMPSRAEAFGMMAIEAMACGKPSIVMSGTALPCVVKEKEGGGVVVPQGDIEKFTEEIKRLVENKDARKSIGDRAYKLAQENYSIQKYLNTVVELYGQIIGDVVPDARASFILEQQKELLPNFTLKPPVGIKLIYPKYLWFKIKRRLKHVECIRYLYYDIYLKSINTTKVKWNDLCIWINYLD